MAEDDKAAGKPVLPGNRGPFGPNDATDDAKTLEDHPAPGGSAAEGPKQTGAGERS